jgi:c-di-GMP phosphodiesterase
MTAGVLQDVTLDYQLLWNAQRHVAGVRINLAVLPYHHIDPVHLLAALLSAWHPKAPELILSHLELPLLTELLKLDLGPQIRLAIPAEHLSDVTLAQQIALARHRGVQMAWEGQPGQTPLPAQAVNFSEHIISLSPEQALQALRVSLHQQHGNEPTARLGSPVHAHQIVDRVPSQVLARHCLDRQGARAVIGWPMEDALYAYRQARIQPSLSTLRGLLQAIEADASMDQVEHQLGQDPVLAYRFLRYVNSAGLGFDRAIDSLRQGLVVLGLSRTASWLGELAPVASQYLDLEPVRLSLVLRGRFMGQLLDAGESDALRRELSLCGLLSHIDWLTGESMANTLRALPLPTRVTEALLSQEGPYWPFLAIASALENPYPTPPHALCAQHSFDIEEVNLTLLRCLAELRAD